MPAKIMTLHPDPNKRGVNIDRASYDIIKVAILDCLITHGEVLLTGLALGVSIRLGDAFDGSVNWYVPKVRRDLEARGIIEEVTRFGQKRIKLKDNVE